MVLLPKSYSQSDFYFSIQLLYTIKLCAVQTSDIIYIPGDTCFVSETTNSRWMELDYNCNLISEWQNLSSSVQH